MKSGPVNIYTEEDVRSALESGQIAAAVLQKVLQYVQPGVTTALLEKVAQDEIAARQAEPAFLNFKGYPFCTCTSINEEVAHAMPSPDRVLKEGDILSIDLGVRHKDICSDHATTVAVGKADPEHLRLIQTTKKALYAAIRQAKVGNTIRDISAAIEDTIRKAGFDAVRALTGHGVGRLLHEPPEIPNYKRTGPSIKLREGMILAIEPMAAIKSGTIGMAPDGWAVATIDGSVAAHFEHTVAITKKGPKILTRLVRGKHA